MPYVSSGLIIEAAYANHYAVPAFNFENLEMAQAIIRAAESQKSPVILQTTPSTADYIGLEQAYAIVFSLARGASVPIALHLDHCESCETISHAIKAGYNSVMIDASKLPFQENIKVTKCVVKEARTKGITIEAELGNVGGKEDGLVVENAAYTDPKEAEEFIQSTGVNIFAPAIGTSHGFYKGKPTLDFERLAEIQRRTKVPLVLHGGSGVPDEYVRRCISLGIAKVNYATELRFAVTVAVRETLLDDSVIDPKKYMGKARNAVEKVCVQKIHICNSANRM